MTTAGPTPQIPDVLRAWWASRERAIHTALPGKITAYDATTQTVTVAPQVQQAVQDSDGYWIHEDLPEIYDVPVWTMGAGLNGVTTPIAVGDTGLILFCERDIGQWRYTGQSSSPGDQRCHSLAGAVFLPGLRPVGETAAANPTHMVVTLGPGVQLLVGESATQFVAMANLVTTALNTLKTAITNAGTTPGDGGAAFKAALVVALSAWPPALASTTLKAE